MAIGRKRILQEARLNEKDFAQINKKRRDYNKLGYSYQLTFVRLFNRMPTTKPFEVVGEILTYAASILNLNSDIISTYKKRRQTITQHQSYLIQYLAVSRLDEESSNLLKEYIFQQSLRLEQSVVLETLARQFLKELKVLEPAKTTISRLIVEQRSKARDYIFKKISSEVPPNIQTKLEHLLTTEEDSTTSILYKIKTNPKKPSPEAMLAVINKLKIIEEIKIFEIDLS